MGAYVWRRSDDTDGAASKPNVAAQPQSQSQTNMPHYQPCNITDQTSAGPVLKRSISAPKGHPQPSALCQPSDLQASCASISANPQAGMAAAGAVTGDSSTGVEATLPARRYRTGGPRSTVVQAEGAPYEGTLQPHPKRRRHEDSAAFVAGAWTTHECNASSAPSVQASSYTCGPAPRNSVQRHDHAQAPGSISGGTIPHFFRNPDFAPGPTRTPFLDPYETMPIPTVTPGAGIGAAAAGRNVGSVSAAARGGPHVTAARGPPVATSADPVAQVAKTEAALEELRRQLAAKEATVRAKQNDLAARQAAKVAKEAAQRAEVEQRRAQLSRGLAALVEAAAPGGKQGAEAPGGLSGRLAGPEEVRRVLGAVSDYEVLQLPTGCTATEVRKAYRRLAASLHPDKCREQGAQEAFIRATAAYNGLLRRCGG
ncbi:hypothetical protein Vretimale_14104 [Volvox reticuliferus]|uniref:Uncharacterized protein n=1 Tax=Volvox reticuliferus TaxID=1737510 RepID=A0A8J4CTD5_9CHLO|nr:hypothetical protein Vretifemale_16271 [Volvox reticuliferus]GIM10355.1 hypothetical protein Vretimale_14104 [Volvox reticuliferus]